MLPLAAAGSLGRFSASSILAGPTGAVVGAADALETETVSLGLVFVAALLAFAIEVVEEADFVLPWPADADFVCGVELVVSFESRAGAGAPAIDFVWFTLVEAGSTGLGAGPGPGALFGEDLACAAAAIDSGASRLADCA